MPFLKRTSVSDISGSDLAGLVSDFIEVTPSDVTTLDYILSQTSAKNVAGLLHDSEMIKFVIKKVAKAKLQPLLLMKLLFHQPFLLSVVIAERSTSTAWETSSLRRTLSNAYHYQ